ncbi:hypothetical protein [Hymenobacter sp. BT730]|uniref:hypothetical protein n=1 Tax=Hymenobacter sp. BT730 TaxID=3063332 RepID=UPI0026E01D5D|nr:hypothetical protein [Hymenobacter sp. BT730]
MSVQAFIRTVCFGVIGLCLSAVGLVRAQSPADTLRQQFMRYQQQAVQEKLFLHLDRPTYLSGEMMWFKVYVVDGTYARPLPLSSVAYVEVLDKAQQPVLQGKVPLQKATGQGSFLLPATLLSGQYTVRAYTSWMKNFGPEFYFQQPVAILNTLRPSGTVAASDTAGYDVQFFPEGGHLVKNLPGKVAFKVLDKSGRSLAATGSVLDAQDKAVAAFQTLRFGMGSFSFTPTGSGQAYTAVLTLSNGQRLTRRLPAVQEAGYVLHLEETSSQQLTLTVQASSAVGPETILLLGQARHQLLLTAQAPLVAGRAVFTVNREKLAEGISHFTVFNTRHQPLCERLYFRQPQQQLVISAQTDKPQYASREKVALQLKTVLSTGQAVPANLSVAVYRLDSLSAAAVPSFNSYLWLTSDLKGAVEQPAYYLTATGPEVAAAADNLMLTHGWSRFSWDKVLASTPLRFEFPPELRGHLVQARVQHSGTGQPVSGLTTYLASPSRTTRVFNSVSGADGRIQFEVNGLYGLRDLVLQANTQQDSMYRCEILNPFSQRFMTPPSGRLPIFSSYFRADIARRHQQVQLQNAYSRHHPNQYRLLTPTDTLAFYGQPDERYRLDDFTRFKVLEEVLREYVVGVKVRIRKDGFHFTVSDKVNRTIFTGPPLVLLDGVPVFNTNRLMAMDPLRIQKLEVVDSRYMQGRLMYNGIVSFTTYKGNLEGFQLDPQALVQEYEALQQPREFYAPRYDTPQEKQSRLPDLRNLLYWNPNVNTTNLQGETLSFYTSDQRGRYLVVVQGLTEAGMAGTGSCTFEVNPAL